MQRVMSRVISVEMRRIRQDRPSRVRALVPLVGVAVGRHTIPFSCEHRPSSSLRDARCFVPFLSSLLTWVKNSPILTFRTIFLTDLSWINRFWIRSDGRDLSLGGFNFFFFLQRCEKFYFGFWLDRYIYDANYGIFKMKSILPGVLEGARIVENNRDP